MAQPTLVGGDFVQPGRAVVDGLLRDGVAVTQAFWTFNPQHDQPRFFIAVPDSARTGYRPVLAAIDRQLAALPEPERGLIDPTAVRVLPRNDGLIQSMPQVGPPGRLGYYSVPGSDDLVPFYVYALPAPVPAA